MSSTSSHEYPPSIHPFLHALNDRPIVFAIHSTEQSPLVLFSLLLNHLEEGQFQYTFYDEPRDTGCGRPLRVAFDGSEEAIRFLEDPRIGQLLPDNARLEPQEPLGATDPQAILRPPADGERHYRLKTLDPNGGAFAPDSWLDSLELERQRWEFTSGLVPVLLASLSRGEGLRVDEGGVIVPGGSGVETRVSAEEKISSLEAQLAAFQLEKDEVDASARAMEADYTLRCKALRQELSRRNDKIEELKQKVEDLSGVNGQPLPPPRPGNNDNSSSPPDNSSSPPFYTNRRPLPTRSESNDRFAPPSQTIPAVRPHSQLGSYEPPRQVRPRFGTDAPDYKQAPARPLVFPSPPVNVWGGEIEMVSVVTNFTHSLTSQGVGGAPVVYLYNLWGDGERTTESGAPFRQMTLEGVRRCLGGFFSQELLDTITRVMVYPSTVSRNWEIKVESNDASFRNYAMDARQRLLASWGFDAVRGR